MTAAHTPSNSNGDAPLSYTLWSLGRLLGETDFEFPPCEDRERRGWLIPTKDGEPLVAIAAGVSEAMEAAMQAYDLEEAAADIAAAVDRRDALQLELRGPDGNVVPVQRLTIRDTVIFMPVAKYVEPDRSWYESLTEEERAAFDASIDEEVEQEKFHREAVWKEPVLDEEPGMVLGVPRYEIVVMLPKTDESSPPT
jgi:hypothetical protein